MNFFKEIKENSSINNIGSRIKTISQTNWLPETKEMIANATSSIATNLEPNPAQSNMPSAQRSPQPTRQRTESRTSSNSSPKINVPRDHRPKYDQDEPIYETNKKLPQIPSRPEHMRSPLSRNTSYRSRSPDSPADDPNKIDPLQYTALVDTNQALKIELQRLSAFETKCKQLEKEASNANTLKETNLNLERRVADYEARCERLEAEMNSLKTRSDILTDENIALNNKIKDLDRTIEHNEQTLCELRDKEGLLRKEIDSLTESRHSSNDLNEQKIRSLEQANQILESEMEGLRAQQKSEREKLKEKMHLLNSKQAEKLKKIEQEKNSLEEEVNSLRSGVQASDDMHKELVTLKDLNLKYEDEIDYLRQQLGDKKCELENVMKQRDAEIQNYLEKLKILNDENLSLCNQFSSNSMSKDEELNKLSQQLAHTEQELGLAKSKIASLEKELAAKHSQAELMEKKVCRIQSLEKECADLALTNGKNEDLIKSLRSENENLRHELDESKASRDQLEHRLTDQTLRNESLAADLSLRHIEIDKIDSYKSKCANLERELDELKRLRGDRGNDFDSRSRKLSESSEKYEYEMKILNAQIHSLQNDLRLKDQECTQLEKLLESERKKTNSLIQQIDELKTSNTDLSMQLSDSRRRLVSLDLINEECNQLRKNLTSITIESESKKAECMTLTSHITILENSLKSLRDSNQNQSNLETSLEKVSHELRKKHDDYKKLQQTHDSVKKEQLETIEMLEEKLKDVEKKTELQALKHEEILLELESIRARRERLLPLCPNCSQTYSMYQSHQAPNHSQNHSPKSQYVPYVHANGQLLSIAIPQQPILSPMMSPMQAHLPQFQVIHLAGKQSVTVECQTSPLNHCRENIEQQAVDRHTKEVERQKVSRHVQTYDFDSFKFMESRAVNTDKIEVQVKSSQTVKIAEVKVVSRNQAINVNMFEEMKRNSSAQTTPVMPKVCDEKSVQCEEKDWPKQKYYLYLSKYSYDPMKNSPNQNPALELALKAGDYLFVLSDKEDEGYFSGELLNGRRGLAPSNFVERVKFDSLSFSNALESLPKEVLSSPKMAEVLSTYEVKLGNILIQLQENIQKFKLNSTKSDMLLTAPQAIVAPKQTIVSKSDKQYLSDPAQEEQIKIGLPYPNNLRVEKRSEKSLLIYWDPPSAPLPFEQSIESDYNPISDFNSNVEVAYYNLFLNNELHSVINGNDELIAVIDDIDLSVPNRISLQAAAGKDRMSKPQECTLLFGSNRSFAPSNLAVHNLSQASAIVSWWPSSSQFSHIISIDSIEHRTLRPGVHRFKLSGLLPDTSHLITITAQIHNHANELNSNYAASIEFRTLASRCLAQPTHLSIDKDPNELDAFCITWHPVISLPSQMSNGIAVGGYSIYLDGTRVHQILNPTASSVSLSSKLLMGAKTLTLRTLSLDGNSESKDSEPIKLSKSFLEDARKAAKQDPVSQLHRPKAVPAEPVKRVPAQMPAQMPTQMPKLTDASRKKKPESRTSVDNEADLYENNRSNAVAVSGVKKSSRQSSPSSSVGGASKSRSKSKGSRSYRWFIALFDYDPLKMSPNTDSCQEELPFKKGQLIKIYGEQDSDGFFYGESNGRSGFIPCNMVSEVQADEQEVVSKMLDSEEKSKRRTSVGQKSPQAKSKVTSARQVKTVKPDQQFVPIGKYSKCKTMVALYDYDPQSLSPNMDADAELAFKTGQIITVYDEMDEDGFFMGELNGKRGLVPSNFLQPLDQSSQYGDKK